MNDEIKEIYFLDLKWIKTHDNMGGVMGNVIFKDNISYEEYNKLSKSVYFILCDKDYITNLQEENERLSVELNQNMIERNNYLSRCEKAIEYIKSPEICIDIRKTDGTLDFVSTDELLKILNGDNE